MRGEKQEKTAHQDTAESIGQKEIVRQEETVPGRTLPVRIQDPKTGKEQKIIKSAVSAAVDKVADSQAEHQVETVDSLAGEEVAKEAVEAEAVKDRQEVTQIRVDTVSVDQKAHKEVQEDSVKAQVIPAEDPAQEEP